MPFCPECYYEYRKEIKSCPECKQELIEDLPISSVSNENYVEIYMVSNRMEADIIQQMMKQNGIVPLIRDLRSFPVLPDFGRRVRLRIAIPERHERVSRKLLEEAISDGVLTNQGQFL